MKQLFDLTNLLRPTTPNTGDAGRVCLGSEASGW